MNTMNPMNTKLQESKYTKLQESKYSSMKLPKYPIYPMNTMTPKYQSVFKYPNPIGQ